MTIALTSLRLLVIAIELTSITAWYLEARPSLKYTSSGGSPTITCYNISSTTTVSRNSRWYKVSPNGTLQQLPTDTSARVRSDRSQLRVSSARSEDNGTYCCKGTMQALDACDESATATLIITIPPVLVPGENQTVFVTNNVTVECVITDVGNPHYGVYRWEKSGQRLVTDGRKYASQLIGNRMFLTIINSTINDGGHYQCIVETPVYQRRQVSVYLIVNNTRTAHAGLTNVILPNTNYSLQIFGTNELSVGMNLTIKCTVMKSSSSVETNDIQLCLVLPTGKVIKGREFSTVATLEHNGTYSCIALLDGSPTVVSLPVIVHGQSYSNSCDDQNRTVQSTGLAIISTLSVIIAILLILLLLLAAMHLRKRLTTNGQKHTAIDKAHYISANPWHLVLPIHRQLQYSSRTTTMPLRRFNSDNFLSDHTQVCLQYQDSRGDNKTKPYLPNDQPAKAATALSNSTTGGIAINKTNTKSMQVVEPKGSNDEDDDGDGDDDDHKDFIPSITHPLYINTKKNKI